MPSARGLAAPYRFAQNLNDSHCEFVGQFEETILLNRAVTTAEVETSTGTVVQVFSLAHAVPADTWSGMITDEEINRMVDDAERLKDEGFDIARRTVAKYREAMGIPPSNERKRLA